MSELDNEYKKRAEEAQRLEVELATIRGNYDTVTETLGRKVEVLETSVRECQVRIFIVHYNF